MENKIWVKYYVGGILNETITFGEARNRIEKRKTFFNDKKIIKGDRIIVKMNNSIDAIINYLTLSEMGIIAVPINPKDSKNRLDFIIQDCSPKALIDENNNLSIFKGDINNNLPETNNINTIIYTSGTTGTPKGVCLSLDNWKNNAKSLIKHHDLDENTILATPLPIFHCNAHGLGMYSTYFSGSTLILFDKVPENFLDIINDEKVNIVSIVPAILKKILSSNNLYKAHKDFKYFLTAAAPLSVDLLDQVINNWNTRVVQGYGLTESTNFSCTLPTNLSEDIYNRAMFPHPSIGVELDNVKIKIDKNNLELKSGELFISSDSNSLGYWGKDISGRVCVDTGDIGYYKIIDGNKFFYLKGRKKEMINRGGEKIYPLELESEIKSLGGLGNDFHIISIKDDNFDEEVGMVVLEEFDFSILEKIPYYRRPKKVFKINNFCTTSTGKIQRNKLSEICEKGLDVTIIWKDERTKNRN